MTTTTKALLLIAAAIALAVRPKRPRELPLHQYWPDRYAP